MTAWHNFTGRNSLTGELLSDIGAIPNFCDLYLPHRVEENRDMEYIEWRWHRVHLYEDEENLMPIWWEHPKYGRKVDMVIVKIEDFNVADVETKPVNSNNLQLSDLKIIAGMDAFILRFPRGMTGGASFPIWKRGSIASEPDIDIGNLPKLYIDTATRKGMSGAPVYAQEKGTFALEGGSLHENFVMGIGHRFLGLYSGRIGDDTFLAQLGIVWKEQAIIEIIEGKKVGESAFNFPRSSK